MSTPGKSGPAGVEACPCRRSTSGVQPIIATLVRGSDWAVTVVRGSW